MMPLLKAMGEAYLDYLKASLNPYLILFGILCAIIILAVFWGISWLGSRKGRKDE